MFVRANQPLCGAGRKESLGTGLDDYIKNITERMT